jgi:phosphoglycerate dehydrogenase-like enzyme
VKLLPLEALLAEADVISLHAPHVPGARALIGSGELQRMKAGAILINTSRGELIDEAALVAALEAQHLSGAALDVLAVEPLAADSPLRGRPDVLLTPHMAFYSEESLVDLQRIAAEEVARVLSGQAPHHRVA